MTSRLWIAILAACGRSVSLTPEDCEGMPRGARADACWAAVLPEVLRTDPDRVEREAEARIADDQTRDFLYLQITRDVDPGSMRWCNRIREKLVQERCKVIVRRPHLHRALGAGAAGGAPPPGQPPGGAPPPGQPPGGAPPPAGEP